MLAGLATDLCEQGTEAGHLGGISYSVIMVSWIEEEGPRALCCVDCFLQLVVGVLYCV